MKKKLTAALAAWGCDIDSALPRMLNDEDFYLDMVREYGKYLSDEIAELDTAAANGDAKQAFQAAHKLKGTLGNLSLTPLYRPICELTEIFRKGTVAGSDALLSTVSAAKAEFYRILAED